MDKLYTVSKTRLGADCGSDHELLIAKFRLKLKKVEKTTRSFSSVQISSVTQSCPTLRDPMDCSPPVSFVHGIFQARVLEWGAIAFSEKDLIYVIPEWCSGFPYFLQFKSEFGNKNFMI